jgi:hypothetical protein
MGYLVLLRLMLRRWAAFKHTNSFSNSLLIAVYALGTFRMKETEMCKRCNLAASIITIGSRSSDSQNRFRLGVVKPG